MLLLVWNIKQISTNKIIAPTSGAVITTILNQYDVAVILEGRHGQGPALTAGLNGLVGGNWNTYSIDTPALGNEAESVLIMCTPAYTAANLALFVAAGGWGAGLRRPVSFDVTGPMHGAAGAAATRTIMAWHAPPDPNDVVTCWGQVRNSNLAGFDLLCGDFNSNVVAPGGFTDAAPGTGGTTLTNPRMRGGGAFTSERHDRMFVNNNTGWQNCGKVNPITHMIGQGGYSKSGRKRGAGLDERASRDAVYATSDHVPMRIEL